MGNDGPDPVKNGEKNDPRKKKGLKTGKKWIKNGKTVKNGKNGIIFALQVRPWRHFAKCLGAASDHKELAMLL